MFQAGVVEKIKTRFLFSDFCLKVGVFLNNVGKFGTHALATDDNIIRRMRIVAG